MSILNASKLSCEKQDRLLFQDIDLTLDKGDFVLLRGENGAGKTSLMRMLVGLSAPQSKDAGSVTINGHCVSRNINDACAKLVYCGHKLGFSGMLSATENLQYWLSLNGLYADNIEETLHLLGLAGNEDLPVKFLSAGQQRRVSLAKLWLHKNSNVWVLDEPFTALDVNIVATLEDHISDFLRKGGAVLMTSHQAVSIEYPHKELSLEYMW